MQKLLLHEYDLEYEQTRPCGNTDPQTLPVILLLSAIQCYISDPKT